MHFQCYVGKSELGNDLSSWSSIVVQAEGDPGIDTIHLFLGCLCRIRCRLSPTIDINHTGILYSVALRRCRRALVDHSTIPPTTSRCAQYNGVSRAEELFGLHRLSDATVGPLQMTQYAHPAVITTLDHHSCHRIPAPTACRPPGSSFAQDLHLDWIFTPDRGKPPGLNHSRELRYHHTL